MRTPGSVITGCLLLCLDDGDGVVVAVCPENADLPQSPAASVDLGSHESRDQERGTTPTFLSLVAGLINPDGEELLVVPCEPMLAHASAWGLPFILSLLCILFPRCVALST